MTTTKDTKPTSATPANKVLTAVPKKPTPSSASSSSASSSSNKGSTAKSNGKPLTTPATTKAGSTSTTTPATSKTGSAAPAVLKPAAAEQMGPAPTPGAKLAPPKAAADDSHATDDSVGESADATDDGNVAATEDGNHVKKVKGAQSSFLIFSADRRKSVSESNPSAKAIEVSQLLGLMWAELTKEERKKWEDAAAEDKKRVLREKAELGITDEPKRGKKRERDGVPKNAPTAYMLWASAKRRELASEREAQGKEKLTAKEINAELSKWKALSEEDKALWQAKYKTLKVESDKKIAEYEAENPTARKTKKKGEKKRAAARVTSDQEHDDAEEDAGRSSRRSHRSERSAGSDADDRPRDEERPAKRARVHGSDSSRREGRKSSSSGSSSSSSRRSSSSSSSKGRGSGSSRSSHSSKKSDPSPPADEAEHEAEDHAGEHDE